MKIDVKRKGLLVFIFDQIDRISVLAKKQTAQMRDERARANAYLDRTNDIAPH